MTTTYDVGTCKFCHKPLTTTSSRIARFGIKQYCNSECRTNAFVRRRIEELFPELSPELSTAMDAVLDSRLG